MRRHTILTLVLTAVIATQANAQQWSLLYWSGPGIWPEYEMHGVEFAEDWYFISATDFLTPNPVILKADREGNLLAVYSQGGTGWGWRDLTYDGTWIYGSDSFEIEAMDLNGNLVPSMNIPGPISPCRALAYDPMWDHFWVASWSQPLCEIDRAGTILWSGDTGLSQISGLAWDDGAPDGPWLWLADQEGGITFHQFDPISHTMTGYSYTLPLLPGLTEQFSGGLFFTDEWDSTYYVMGGNAQGTPGDGIYILEMYPDTLPQHNVSVSLTYLSGSPVPASGGFIDYQVSLINNESNPVSFDAWIMVQLPDSSWYGPVLGPAHLTLPAGGIITRNRSQFVPGGAPPGAYSYETRIGIYPHDIWDSDSFNFEKLGTESEALEDGWKCSGDPFPQECLSWIEFPAQPAILDAYPNPFNSTTTISYALPSASPVRLTVYDLQGRTVAKLVDGMKDAGVHEVTWDATGFTSGIYFYRIEAGKFRAVRKTLLVK